MSKDFEKYEENSDYADGYDNGYDDGYEECEMDICLFKDGKENDAYEEGLREGAIEKEKEYDEFLKRLIEDISIASYKYEAGSEFRNELEDFVRRLEDI